jgi:hypothetical protein
VRFLGEGAQSRDGRVTPGRAPTAALLSWADDLRSPALQPHAPEPALEEPDDEIPFYMSADSAPVGYTARRPSWVAPTFLALLAVVSAAIALVAGTLTGEYARLLGTLTRVAPGEIAPAGASVSIRPFAMAVFALLALFAVGPWRSKVRLLFTAWIAYAVLGLAIDALLALTHGLGTPAPLSPVGGILAALAVLFTAVLVVFSQYTFPPGVRVPTLVRRPGSRLVLFVAASTTAAIAAVLVHV